MVASKQWRGLRAERYKDEGVKRVQNIALITSCSADNLLRALPLNSPLPSPSPEHSVRYHHKLTEEIMYALTRLYTPVVKC